MSTDGLYFVKQIPFEEFRVDQKQITIKGFWLSVNIKTNLYGTGAETEAHLVYQRILKIKH
jgi:hypothetical protein